MLNEIRTYLMAHPNAKDTVDGVQCWCKLQGGGDYNRLQVQAALDALIERKWLVKRESQRGPTLYARRRAGRDNKAGSLEDVGKEQ